MRLAILLAATLASQAAAQTRRIDDLQWLVGCWERTRATGRTIELWSAPKDGIMMGTSYSVTDTSSREVEQLRLWFAGDTLIYEAHPAGQARTEFRSTTVSPMELIFENPAHDFPQKISYRRVGTDSVIARVEGDRAGRAQPINFPFKRAACGTRTVSATASTRVELQRMYDGMAAAEARQAGGRFAWLAEQSMPGYRYTIWPAAGSSVAVLDSLMLQRAADSWRRAPAPAARRYSVSVERVLLRGDTADALVSASLAVTTVDSAGRIGPAGASHVREVSQRWIDSWIRTRSGLRLRSSSGVSEDVSLDGKPIISDGRPVRTP